MLILFILTLFACNPSSVEITEDTLSLQKNIGVWSQYDIPTASEEELSALTKNGDGTLDYRIARKTAIIEFETGYRIDFKIA